MWLCCYFHIWHCLENHFYNLDEIVEFEDENVIDNLLESGEEKDKVCTKTRMTTSIKAMVKNQTVKQFKGK